MNFNQQFRSCQYNIVLGSLLMSVVEIIMTEAVFWILCISQLEVMTEILMITEIETHYFYMEEDLS